MQVEIKTPMLPESVSEGTLLEWHKEVGESFRRDELLLEIETEKIVLEVPAPSDGTLSEVIKAKGDVILEDEVLGLIETNVSSSASSPVNDDSTGSTALGIESSTNVKDSASSNAPQSDESASEIVLQRFSPAARRVAVESGIDVNKVEGTGKDGRVTKENVLNLSKGAADTPQPVAPDAQTAVAVATPHEIAPMPPSKASLAPQREKSSRSVRQQPMSRIRRTIASRLVQAQQTAALLTTFNEADMSAIIDVRKKYRDSFESKHDARLGFMSFFVKAAVEALRSVPSVNAIIDGNDILAYDYCDVGIAVSSPRGLVVPIIRDAQNLSLAQIEKQVSDFGARAKAGTLSLDELTGGTFTITNGGVFGSLVSTPIVNPPQSAILGMHKIQHRPVVVDDEIVARPMMYLALTYDHRIIDGREAVTFLVSIKEALEDPLRMLLEI